VPENKEMWFHTILAKYSSLNVNVIANHCTAL